MRDQRLCRWLAASALALCALPATADAAMRKATGETSQGKRALMWIRGDGSVALIAIKFDASCRRGEVWADGMRFRSDPETRETDTVSVGGKFRSRYRGGTAAFNTRVTAQRRPDGGYHGAFRTTVAIYNKGKRLTDLCKTGVLTWTVGPPA
jgi:hypothetical protein